MSHQLLCGEGRKRMEKRVCVPQTSSVVLILVGMEKEIFASRVISEFLVQILLDSHS